MWSVTSLLGWLTRLLGWLLGSVLFLALCLTCVGAVQYTRSKQRNRSMLQKQRTMQQQAAQQAAAQALEKQQQAQNATNDRERERERDRPDRSERAAERERERDRHHNAAERSSRRPAAYADRQMESVDHDDDHPAGEGDEAEWTGAGEFSRQSSGNHQTIARGRRGPSTERERNGNATGISPPVARHSKSIYAAVRHASKARGNGTNAQSANTLLQLPKRDGSQSTSPAGSPRPMTLHEGEEHDSDTQLTHSQTQRRTADGDEGAEQDGLDSESSHSHSSHERPTKERQLKSFEWSPDAPARKAASGSAANSSSAATAGGASAASPHLSSAAATLLAMFPQLSPAQFSSPALAAASAAAALPSSDAVIYQQLLTVIHQAHAQRLLGAVSDTLTRMIAAEVRAGKMKAFQADILRCIMAEQVKKEQSEVEKRAQEQKEGSATAAPTKPGSIVPLASKLLALVENAGSVSSAAVPPSGPAAAAPAGTASTAVAVSIPIASPVSPVDLSVALPGSPLPPPTLTSPTQAPVPALSKFRAALSAASAGSSATGSPTASPTDSSSTWSKLKLLMNQMPIAQFKQALGGHEGDTQHEEGAAHATAAAPHVESTLFPAATGAASALPLAPTPLSAVASHPLSLPPPAASPAVTLLPVAPLPPLSFPPIPPLPPSLSAEQLVSLNLSFLADSHAMRAQITQQLCLELNEAQGRAMLAAATSATPAAAPPAAISPTLLYSEMYQLLQSLHATLSDRLQQRMQQRMPVVAPQPQTAPPAVTLAAPSSSVSSTASTSAVSTPLRSARSLALSETKESDNSFRQRDTSDDSSAPSSARAFEVHINTPSTSAHRPFQSNSNGHSSAIPSAASTNGRPALHRPASFPVPMQSSESLLRLRADHRLNGGGNGSAGHGSQRTSDPVSPVQRHDSSVSSRSSGDSTPQTHVVSLRTPPAGMPAGSTSLLTPSPGSVAAVQQQLREQQQQQQQQHDSSNGTSNGAYPPRRPASNVSVGTPAHPASASARFPPPSWPSAQPSSGVLLPPHSGAITGGHHRHSPSYSTSTFPPKKPHSRNSSAGGMTTARANGNSIGAVAYPPRDRMQRSGDYSLGDGLAELGLHG